MKKLTEDQIQDMVGRKERFKIFFLIAIFVAVVVNAFYFCGLYEFGGEKTISLVLVEVFNILLLLGVYILFLKYWQNNVTDVSYFLWYMDSFLSLDREWKYGKKPFMFVKQWRMYSTFQDLFHDVMQLKECNSMYSICGWISLLLFLPIFLCGSVMLLFCGENARIYSLLSDDIAFHLFFIPMCVFILLFILSFLICLRYKVMLNKLITDSDKCSITATEVKDLI